MQRMGIQYVIRAVQSLSSKMFWSSVCEREALLEAEWQLRGTASRGSSVPVGAQVGKLVSRQLHEHGDGTRWTGLEAGLLTAKTEMQIPDKWQLLTAEERKVQWNLDWPTELSCRRDNVQNSMSKIKANHWPFLLHPSPSKRKLEKHWIKYETWLWPPSPLVNDSLF